MDNKLTIYDCDDIIRQIEATADMNDGEISEQDMQELVEAQTASIEKLGKLINYIGFLDGFIATAKHEIGRIQARKKTAENRIEGIKKYLLPYIEKNGPKTVGTHRISTRKSKAVVLVEGFNHPEYGEEVTVFKPDKKKIRESIESGIEVKGAILENRVNVQIR